MSMSLQSSGPEGQALTVKVEIEAKPADQLATLLGVAERLRSSMLNPATCSTSPARMVCGIATDFGRGMVIVEAVVPQGMGEQEVIDQLRELLLDLTHL